MIFYPNPNHVVVVPKLNHIRTTRSQLLIWNWNSYLWFAVTYNANIYSADLVVTSVILSWPVLKLSTGIFTIHSSCIVTFSGVAALLTGCHDCFLPSSYHTVDTQQTEAPWSAASFLSMPMLTDLACLDREHGAPLCCGICSVLSACCEQIWEENPPII